jgi:hypothetical protein
MKLIEINLLNIEWNFRLMSVTSTSTRFFYAWIQMCIYLYFLIIHSHYLNRTCERINRKEIFFRLQTLEFCHHFPTLVSRLFYQSSYKIGVKLEFRNWQHRQFKSHLFKPQAFVLELSCVPCVCALQFTHMVDFWNHKSVFSKFSSENIILPYPAVWQQICMDIS